MRDYQPIWIKLKSLPRDKAETEGVSIIANRNLHPRILKAVVKEKWMDMAYKLANEKYNAILSHKKEHSKLTFFLTQERRYTPDDF
jgi:hypothetical protein